MLFKLIRDGEETAVQSYEERPASKLSVAGKRMGDILALDADGRLVIVEIKRDWSDRATVGQLLEYAAEMTGKSYEDLENWIENTGPDAMANAHMSPC